MYLKMILLAIGCISSVGSVRIVTFNETDLAMDAANPSVVWPSGITCDFDSNSKCKWFNWPSSTNFNWKLGRGKDSHRKGKKKNTGVKDDHGEGGGYLYISSGRLRNRTARLVSHLFELPKPGCLRFWYHMRGRHMGHLILRHAHMSLSNISAVNILWEVLAANNSILWKVYGGQGDQWQEGVIPMKNTEHFHVFMFEAFDWDAGKAGNIVLDDISFNPLNDTNKCIFSPTAAAPPTQLPITTASTSSGILNNMTTPIVISTTSKLASSTSITTTTNRTPGYFSSATKEVTKLTEKAQTTSSEMIKILPSSVRTTSLVKDKATNSKVITESVRNAQTSKQYTTGTVRNDGAPNSINQESKTASRNEVTVKSNSDNTTIYAAVSVCVTLTVLVVALVSFLRCRKRRSFNFYDNSTVHMTRMYPEIIKKDTVLEYRKLT